MIFARNCPQVEKEVRPFISIRTYPYPSQSHGIEYKTAALEIRAFHPFNSARSRPKFGYQTVEIQITFQVGTKPIYPIFDMGHNRHLPPPLSSQSLGELGPQYY